MERVREEKRREEKRGEERRGEERRREEKRRVAKDGVFPMICGPGGSKRGSLKPRVRSHVVR